jgi:hypothetical protein
MRELPADEHVLHAGLAIRRAQVLAHHAAVAGERERDAGLGQRDPLDHLGDVSGFGRERSQEFSARGDIEEQVAHADARARRHPARLELGLAAAFDRELGASLCLLVP